MEEIVGLLKDRVEVGVSKNSKRVRIKIY